VRIERERGPRPAPPAVRLGRTGLCPSRFVCLQIPSVHFQVLTLTCSTRRDKPHRGRWGPGSLIASRRAVQRGDGQPSRKPRALPLLRVCRPITTPVAIPRASLFFSFAGSAHRITIAWWLARATATLSYFPSGNFFPVSAKTAECDFKTGWMFPKPLPRLRAAWAKQHVSYRATKSQMFWIPRSPTSKPSNARPISSRASRYSQQPRALGPWHRELPAPRGHGMDLRRNTAEARSGNVGGLSGPVECQDTPDDTSPGRSTHLCAPSSLRPAGLRGTASDGFLLLGAILEGAHRQAGRLLWCWRSRWVHVSRGRRHLGDVGAGLSISVVPAACRHPTPQPLIRRRPAPVNGHSAELRKS
jgi:hypothetical protein